jgi:hypothetical protein
MNSQMIGMRHTDMGRGGAAGAVVAASERAGTVRRCIREASSLAFASPVSDVTRMPSIRPGRAGDAFGLLEAAACEA